MIFDMEQTPEKPEKEVSRSPGEDLRETVLHDLGTNSLHQGPQQANLMAIAEAMTPDWWARREDARPHEVIIELYRYNTERMERAQKKAEAERESPSVPLPSTEPPAQQTAAPPAAAVTLRRGRSPRRDPRTPRRPVPRRPPRRPQEAPGRPRIPQTPAEVPTPPRVTLSGPVDPPIMATLQRTALYLVSPQSRPPVPFPDVIPKPWAELSPRSQADYQRGMVQVQRELQARGYGTPWDMVAYLVETARDYSLSTYKRRRNTVIRYLQERAPKAVELVRALPAYGELCQLLGRQPSRSSTETTRARRGRQDPRTWQRLLSHLSPEHRDALLTLRYTGARSTEARSVRLEAVPDGIQVSITSAKTGSRSKKNKESVPLVRSWVVSLDTAEGAILAGVLARRGSAPAPYSPDALRSVWHRARVAEGLNTDSGWDLHSLRHQFARSEKKKRAKELKEEFGPDWRRRLYGRDWRNNQDYSQSFYGPLAAKLGHTNVDMSRIYG